MSRAVLDREIRRRNHVQAIASARALAAALESGRIPSVIYQGARVRRLMTQDHPSAGARTMLCIGPVSCWVSDAELSDPRGDCPVSVVPR